MKPIAIFYHALFFLDSPDNLIENAATIVHGQMELLKDTGLLNAASEFHVGLNGGQESLELARLLIPSKAKITLHGLQCHNECRTLRMLEQWLPSHADWYVFYFHAKGCTHPAEDPLRTRWRGCMTRNLISNWRQCVADLDAGFESVGCHWMTGAQTPPGQSIWAGNFWYAKASFLCTLPSIMKRERLKVSGLDSVDSRYEGEVWIGNGPRLPSVRDYHGPGWNPSKIATCIP